ncbi:AraC family transcriptional regulator [Streptomyces virginiae]|uniref:AraC family transcriptional regulator n=3 Tax=Streptomyces TaxID=1883 RepID=A0ABQ3NNR4_STRVG|nr:MULTISPECIES: AraC family transcriptional regulator [Streptomyces]KOU82455.1 AraC family transcriptional regulator [Streptomyces sp. XY593]KOU94139.1 AraC family transcriptional regulator [Streptomyces sp. XY533]MBP2341717.1 AraC-like DNA-binding protein [Streptomyces virginiae]MCI4079421.1 AraC family transcriptional regulator [Streptomyces sp. MMS21 TC-5]QNE29384.1 AraC family transcriptional regulator [Streptomyces sp. INR7]
MDMLTGLLEGPQARGAFLLKSVLNPPWAMRIEDRAPLSVATMVRGSAWLLPDDGGDPVLIAPGDVAVVRGPDPYTVADAPGTPVQVTVGPDQRCSTPEGEDVTDSMALGVRTWGAAHQHAGSAVMLSGTYQAPSEIGRRLLGALPKILVRPAKAADATLIDLLASEISSEEPGQEVVLDRLLDLLLIGVLRAWPSAADSGAPAWFRAQSDPVVGPALRLLHESPAHAWTVEELAVRVGVSRASLARRFREVMGEPPVGYLTGWRLALAADMLREPDATVERVARRVGYGSAFALSAAFKRVRGMSPQAFRAGSSGPDAELAPGPGGTVVLSPPEVRSRRG